MSLLHGYSFELDPENLEETIEKDFTLHNKEQPFLPLWEHVKTTLTKKGYNILSSKDHYGGVPHDVIVLSSKNDDIIRTDFHMCTERAGFYFQERYSYSGTISEPEVCLDEFLRSRCISH